MADLSDSPRQATDHELITADGSVKTGLTISSLGAAVTSLQCEGREFLLPVTDAGRDIAFSNVLIGPIINRVRDGRFQLYGDIIQLPVTHDAHSLHSRPHGFDRQLWTPMAGPERAMDTLMLTYMRPDGLMSLPGLLDVRLRAQVAPMSASFAYRAITDRPTPVAMTHHFYFQLPSTQMVDELELQIPADSYTATDAAKLPTDYSVPVSETVLDFRGFRQIGPQIIDHSFNIKGRGMRPHARLRNAHYSLTISSTLPAVQIYTGECLSDCGYRSRQALAVEPQFPPDWVNHPGSESMILRPGQTYAHDIRIDIARRS